MSDVIFVSIFSVLFCGTFLVGHLVMKRRAAARLQAESAEQPAGPALGSWTEAFASQIPQAEAEVHGLDRDLRRAGYYESWARRNFLAIRNALTIVTALMAAGVFVVVGPEDTDRTLKVAGIGLLFCAIVFCIPRLRLKLAGNNRVRRIERGLSDALDMISMCMSGGLSFQTALVRVGQEIHGSHPDLAQELGIIRRQSGVSSLSQALTQFAQRIDGPEVKTMTLLVTQAERLGTDIVTALREYSDGLRRSHRQRAEERANKTGVRLLFPLVMFLMPSVFLLLWGPALLELRGFMRSEMGPGGSLEAQVDGQLNSDGTRRQ